MKQYLLIANLLVASAFSTFGQKLVPVEKPASVKFSISNFGFEVTGEFSGINGHIIFDEKNLSTSSFDVKVNSSSVNTKNKQRDKHLRGEDYFNSSRYAEIRIVSSKIAKSVTAGYYVFFGTVTIKDKTSDISFPFTVVQQDGGYRFKGEFKMKRKDFGVGGSSTISNELTVYLDVLTKIP